MPYSNSMQFGELNLMYCYGNDAESLGWSTNGVSGGSNGTFVNASGSSMPSGFAPLGSRAVTDNSDDGATLLLAISSLGNPNNPPLAAATGFNQIWDTADVSGGANGYLYRPIAPSGYTSMGDVFTSNGTPTFQVWCVRNDLVEQINDTFQPWTTAGVSGGADLTLNQANLPAQSNGSDNPVGGGPVLIPTPTFLGNTGNCYVLNVALALTPASGPGSAPQLTGYSAPVASQDVVDGVVTLPYPMVLGDSGPQGQNKNWQAKNSPFYTLTRYSAWDPVMFLNNTTGLLQLTSRTVESGISDTQTKTFSHTAGIEISAESGVEFLGTGGKVGVKVSYVFGYQTSDSLSSFTNVANTCNLSVPPKSAGAGWVVMRHYMLARTDGSLVSDSGTLTIEGTYTISEYPSAAGVTGNFVRDTTSAH